jgi:hypothetical protein
MDSGISEFLRGAQPIFKNFSPFDLGGANARTSAKIPGRHSFPLLYSVILVWSSSSSQEFFVLTRMAFITQFAVAFPLGVLGAVAVRKPSWGSLLLNHCRFLSSALVFLLSGVVFLAWRAPSLSDPLMVAARFTWLALIHLAILLYAVLFPGSWIGHFLDGLGVIAYDTYLFHDLFRGLFIGRIPWIRSFRQFCISTLALAFTLGFCRLSWLYFEKPLVKHSHRASYEFTNTRPTQAAQHSPEPART